MRIFRFVFLAAALVMAPAAAAWAEGLYFTPKVGYSYLQGKIEDKRRGSGQAVLGLALGYDFQPDQEIPLRAEFEYAWRGKREKFNEDGIKGKAGAQSFFANGYFDIHNDTPITPYIGGGLGLAIVSGEISRGRTALGKTENSFAWNVGTGAAWKISDGAWENDYSVTMDLGYRYADFGKIKEITDNIDIKVRAHEVLLGLRFTF